MTITFDEYATRFSRAALKREGDILEIRLHSGSGSSLVWDEPAHRELPELFRWVASDDKIRVIILTGTGDSFCSSGDTSGWPKLTPLVWDTLYSQGRGLIRNLLDIEAPMIAAINGPATWHAELAVLCDIVLAAEHTVFQDAPHLPYTAPADGVHTVWPTLLGANRGRYFLLTKQQIDALEAKRLGVVNEVLPSSGLLPRAWELARSLAAQDPLTLKYSRLALTMKLRRDVLTDLDHGLSLEGLAALQR